jgi:hypothetical protein
VDCTRSWNNLGFAFQLPRQTENNNDNLYWNSTSLGLDLNPDTFEIRSRSIAHSSATLVHYYYYYYYFIVVIVLVAVAQSV